MLGYAQVLDSIARQLADIADWVSYAAGRVMHDPLWGGAALLAMAVLVGLAILKRRSSS